MSVTDMRLMKVTVPRVGRGSGGGNELPIVERLACNIAALFGVNWPENPNDATWVSHYDALSLKELGSGAPSGTELQVYKITPGNMNRFRPDRKAGALLAGADLLFFPLEDTFSGVLSTIGHNEDNAPLAAEIRLAIWAVLVQECYKAQPALFVAAATARRIQRAMTYEWNALQRGASAGRTDQLEPAADTIVQRTLGILDKTIPDVSDGDQFGRGEHSSAAFLRQDLIERWVNHLTTSPDRGLAWIEAVGARQHVEAFSSTLGSLNSFMDEVSPSEVLIAEEFGTDLLLPRIPSAGELRRLPPTTQRAAIWSAMQIHRLLRDNPRFDRGGADGTSFQRVITGEAERLAELAGAVLEDGDPLVVWARAGWKNKVLVDYREKDWIAALGALEDLRTEIRRMVELFNERRVDPGAMADFLRSFSPIINAIAGDAIDRGDETLARRIRADLNDDWQLFFNALGVLPSELLAAAEPATTTIRELLATHLHNYAGFLSRSESAADRQFAIELESKLVIPAREEVRRTHQSDTSLRLAQQVLIRALSFHSEKTNDLEARTQLAALGAEATAKLLETSYGRLVVGESNDTDLRSGQVNTMTALITGYVLAAESGLSIDGLDSRTVRKLAERAQQELESRSSGADDSGRLIQMKSLGARLASLE